MPVNSIHYGIRFRPRFTYRPHWFELVEYGIHGSNLSMLIGTMPLPAFEDPSTGAPQWAIDPYDRPLTWISTPIPDNSGLYICVFRFG